MLHPRNISIIMHCLNQPKLRHLNSPTYHIHPVSIGLDRCTDLFSLLWYLSNEPITSAETIGYANTSMDDCSILKELNFFGVNLDR